MATFVVLFAVTDDGFLAKIILCEQDETFTDNVFPLKGVNIKVTEKITIFD